MERGGIGREEIERVKEKEKKREREPLRTGMDRGGITPVEELLMSRPKTPFFGHSFSSICPTLWPPSCFFFCRLTSRWSERGGRGAEGKGEWE